MIVKNCWDTTHSGPLVNDYLKKQAGTELCQAQLKLAPSLYCLQLKDNLGS